MPLKLNSSGGGSVTLDVPSTASNFTATIPANTGTVVTTGSTGVVTQTMLAGSVAGNGPAFSARSASDQTVSNNTATKITLATEDFDTASCFSSSRFTPNVAGYYSISGVAAGRSSSTSAAALVEVAIYKNGVASGVPGSYVYIPNSPYFDQAVSQNTVLVYLNGTTDYVEMYGRVIVASGTPTLLNGACVFTGFLARAA